MTHRHLTALAAVVLLAATGCGESRPATGSVNDCSACHGFPPATLTSGDAHPQSDNGAWVATDCAACHITSVDATTGETIPASAGGTHADGKVDGKHGDYSSAAVHGPAANAGIALCQACHGSDLTGGTADYSCTQCHNATLAFTNCTLCHGTRVGTYTAANLPDSAPPADVAGATAITDVTVGVHQAHVTSTIATSLSCGDCHSSTGAVPADIFEAGHIDGGTAEVPFGPVARANGSTPAAWDRTSPTCSGTWCHDRGGNEQSPSWVVADSKGCGSCHKAINPTEPFHARANVDLDCADCHGSLDPAVHVNGVPNLVTDFNCTFCHGTRSAAPTLPDDAAPPLDALGASDAAKIGEHAVHLQGGTYSNGFACKSCHAGVDAYGNRHANGAAEVAFTEAVVAGGTYAAGTCTSTYCHGATLTGGAAPNPTWTGSVLCNSCHGIAPATGKHSTHSSVPCGSCHAGYTATTVDKSLHVNGVVNAIPTAGCHCTPGVW